MGKLFSKPQQKQSRITDTDRSILALKQQRDEITIFRKKLQIQYDQAENSAKLLLSQEKKALALLALKRRKQQGELIHQAEEQLLQLNGLISNVEMSAVQSEVVKAIEVGTQALRRMQEEISLQYVEKLMDTNAELQNEVRDIQEMLAGTERDQKDVFDEYQRLEDIVASEKLQSVPIVPETVPEQSVAPVQETVAPAKPKAPMTQMVRTVPEFEEQ